MKLSRTTTALIAGSSALVLVLAGCSSDDVDGAANSAASASSEATSAMSMNDDAFDFEDGYIKEKAADSMMTGIFGTITNSTDADVTITSFRIEGLDADTSFEQHDTKDGKMFEVEGGLTVPAGGKLELVPGGTHLMIINNKQAMEPGQEYKLVIEFSDGTTIDEDIEVRPQAAGEENYGEDGELENPAHMGGDDHDGHDHDGDHDHSKN